MGKRIDDMRLAGKPIEAGRTYKVAGWASISEDARGEPIWDVVSRYLRARKTIASPKVNTPRVL
jgi:sulfur-oxidizing protein SoxB